MSHVWDRYSVIQGHGQSISQLLPTCTAVALTFPAERRSPRGLWQTLAKKTHTHADLSTRKTRRWRRCGLLGCGNRQRCWRGVVWRWLSPGRAVCVCVCVVGLVSRRLAALTSPQPQDQDQVRPTVLLEWTPCTQVSPTFISQLPLPSCLGA